MKKIILISAILLCTITSFGQSSSSNGYGTQLFPLDKTNVSLTKEIVKISQYNNEGKDLVKIDTYYEFFNPDEETTIKIGFTNEAAGMYGEADTPNNNNLVIDFKVEMNDIVLPTKVSAIWDNDDYYNDGKIKTLTQEDINKELEDFDLRWRVDYSYLHHFDAKFKKGKNTIKNSYLLEWSAEDVPLTYFFYSLSKIPDWANKKVDDFTLQIDMGDLAVIDIAQTFFKDASEIKTVGTGRNTDITKEYGGYIYLDKTFTQYFIKKGYLEFKKQNYKPEPSAVLIIRPTKNLWGFDYKNQDLLPLNYFTYSAETDNDISKKILRNLPFAKRGYVFTNPDLKKYYSKMYWYIPDANYKADVSTLTAEEKEWVKYWSE